jgi:hypothetical protein
MAKQVFPRFPQQLRTIVERAKCYVAGDAEQASYNGDAVDLPVVDTEA